MKKFAATLAAIATLLVATTANAINYDLSADLATYNAGANPHSAFLEISQSNNQTGSQAGLYTTSLGGGEDTGFWVKIDFGSNPQPYLTSAFIKAAHGALVWGEAALADFNAGVFDSITLWNFGANGIKNKNGKYQGTSHAGIDGNVSTTVPDTSSTLALLGLGLGALGFVARRRKA